MSGNSDPSGFDGVPPNARERSTTEFDYIIVGSGAGGAPLAARLAQAGKRVLVLEAGVDPGADTAIEDPDKLTKAENERAIFHCPGFQAASSEPEIFESTPAEDAMSWHFRARHLPGKLQREDPKTEAYEGSRVFYPRCSSIGGCASHNTMVTVYGNDQDWNRIADLTGDSSWQPSRMRYYFKRLERARYTRYRFTRIGKLIEKFVSWLKPGHAAEGYHGMSGWLDITTSDPRIGIGDKQLIATVFSAVEIGGMSRLRRLWRSTKRLFTGQIYQDLDPNAPRTIRECPEGLALIPLASGLGQRGGPREFLLNTRRDAAAGRFGAGDLKIASGVFVKRIIFETGAESPRAVGVEFSIGRHLYGASRPKMETGSNGGEAGNCFVREGGEVILCGGAFNTPQLLMLSGIGETAHLGELDVAGPRDAEGNAVTKSVVDLPGVGRNLRDRYEIPVITRMKDDFEILDGVTYDPDNANDKARQIWNVPDKGSEGDSGRTGLYATSGPSIAVIKKSTQAGKSDPPDLFIFGVPAAFRGYFPTWSKQLFRERPDYAGKATGDAEPECRSLWTWIILKAYTRNRGTVRLRSNAEFEEPEIDFNYFGEDDQEGSRADLEALVEAVAYARRLNSGIKDRIETEVEPNEYDPDKLRHWIKTRAWGHHACGTCRIGKDPWRASVENLVDKEAVVDSRFRVHGVESLRIVDASIFHEIPGYFIVTPTYMIGEKAADTLLESEARYPARLESDEAAAVRERRKRASMNPVPEVGAGATASHPGADPARLPSNGVGLALSGGGIRGATFCLGILQGFARRDRIRDVDFMSTISGGGYTGSFLGRLFTRKEVANAIDPVGKAQDILKDNHSAPVQWMRANANYAHGAGGRDALQIFALLLRNLFTIHFVIALACIGAFGLLRWIADWIGGVVPATVHPPFLAEDSTWAELVSPWWWLPPTALILCVLPGALSYWLAPKPGTTGLLSFFPAAGWAVFLAGLAVIASLQGGFLPAAAAAVVLVATLLVTERARPPWPKKDEDFSDAGSLMRNELTLQLGGFAALFIAAVGWVLLDSAGRFGASAVRLGMLAAIWAVVMPLLPAARPLIGKIESHKSIVFLIAVALAAVLLVLLNASVHTLFGLGENWGVITTCLALALSFIFGFGIDFVNASSLQASRGARLARTFLGASNPARIYGELDARTSDVRRVHAGDDIAFHDYHPEANGGPLHLIGVGLDETVDAASERDIPDKKGLLMTVGPCGLSAGRYHGVWTRPVGLLPRKVRRHNMLDGAHPDENASTASTAIEGIRVPGREFHVLRAKDNQPVPVEPLTLKTWIAISGAAFTTGQGEGTSKPLALLLGLANIRRGYWWDTRLNASDRPGRFREDILRRLKRLPTRLARMQSLLLAEFRARFPGPGHRYWHLSDGGHIESNGIHELLRRRLPLIVSVSVGDSGLEKMEGFIRRARIDFGANITFVAPDPTKKPEQESELKKKNGMAASERDEWSGFPDDVPDSVKDWFHADAFGTLEQTGSGQEKRAALARVSYDCGSPNETWIVVIRPTVTGSEPLDIVNHAKTRDGFPRQPSSDQCFDDAQWESYRKLGELTAREVLKANKKDTTSGKGAGHP